MGSFKTLTLSAVCSLLINQTTVFACDEKSGGFVPFNNIKTLNQGDEITVYSDTKKYIYAVRDVKLVDSNEAWVDLSVKTHMLTISTCNTFGKKEERHVVQADFVRSESL